MKQQLFWKSMLWERSSFEKIAAIEGNVFWKSASSKRVAFQEK